MTNIHPTSDGKSNLPSANRADVGEFFTETIPDQIHLVAIIPDGGTQGHDFGTDAASATDWAIARNGEGKGVYYSVNAVHPGVNKKPTKADITAVRFVHVDIDPPKDGSAWDPAEALARVNDVTPQPSSIIWSGNGWQALWRIEGATVDEAEAINRGLIAKFGGDTGTHNIDRLLRVPGLVNYLSAAKRKRDRVPVETRIKLLHGAASSSASQMLAAFPAPPCAEKKASARTALDWDGQLLSADDLNLAANNPLRRLIENPVNLDRSADTYAFVCEALRRGITPLEITGVLMNDKNAISSHCLGQPNPMRAIERVISHASNVCDVARHIAQRAEDIRIAGGLDNDDAFPTARQWTVEDMVERFVLVSDGSLIADRANPRATLAWQDFRNLTASSMTQKIVTGADGGTRKIERLTSKVWLGHADRKHVDALTFHAGKPAVTQSPEGRSALNTWPGFRFNEPPANWQDRAKLFEEHIRWLWGDNADAFLDWVAHLAQRPGELPSFGWLHIAKAHGMGRNWVAGVLGRVFQGVTALGFDLSGALNTGFNGQLGGKVLVVVDEINEGASGRAHQNVQTLKRLVTEETRTINPKYGRQRVEFNTCRWLIFSNSKTALPLEDEDRRFWVVRCDDQPRPSAYYQDLYAAREDTAFIASVAHFLIVRDIAAFQPGKSPPMTEAKQELLVRTRSEAEQILHDIVARWPVDVITSDELTTTLGENKPNQQAFRHTLDRADFQSLGRLRLRLVGSDFGRVTAYAIRNADTWKTASNSALQAEILRKGDEDKRAAMDGGD